VGFFIIQRVVRKLNAIVQYITKLVSGLNVSLSIAKKRERLFLKVANEVCRRHKEKRFVSISTAFLFGRQEAESDISFFAKNQNDIDKGGRSLRFLPPG
jgi:hypothetical protein